MIVTMQEETLLTSPSAESGYLPVSTYPNLVDNNNLEGRVILLPSMMSQKLSDPTKISIAIELDYTGISSASLSGAIA